MGRVFVTGATGVLGRRVVAGLVRSGHAVRALSRREQNYATLQALGAEPRSADLFDAETLVPALAGVDAVVHAATSIPSKARVREADFAENDRIRSEGTSALASAVLRAGVRAFVYPSIVWTAAPDDGAHFDEGSAVRADRELMASVDAERTVQQLGRQGVAAAVLRYGWFYAHDAATTLAIGAAIRRRAMPLIGDGESRLSLVHADDAATALCAWLAAPRTGLWHVCDGEPVTCASLFRELARLLAAKPPRRVPRWLARLAAGGPTTRFFTRSVSTTGERFARELGWRPRYPSYREGLAEVVRRWEERV